MNATLIAALVACGLSLLLTRALMPLFRRLKLVDVPHTQDRKIHSHPIVLAGGAAIALSFTIVLLVASRVAPELIPQLSAHKWLALISAVVVLFGFGTIDDKFQLPAVIQLCGPIIASLLVIESGIAVTRVTNPFGGVLTLSDVGWVPPLLTFAWLMAMMYGTKLLDGLDGLSTGLSAIGAIMIFGLTHLPPYYEPRIGFLALTFAGACIGFLIINFYPARAFLGEGGSLFVGFVLGILAILSGSKIATTLLVMGLPVLDVVRVMIVRRIRGQPLFIGDQLHLHHLLLRNGFSHRIAVLTYYALAIGFGVTALLLQSRGKLIMLGVLCIVGLTLTTFLHTRLKRNA